MSDPALRRTVRRCAAVLAVPVALVPMMLVARLEDDGRSLSHAILEVGDEVALAVLVGAVAGDDADA